MTWEDYKTEILRSNPPLGKAGQKLTLSAEQFMHRLELAYNRGRGDGIDEAVQSTHDTGTFDFLRGMFGK